jgi:hypothetical protein
MTELDKFVMVFIDDIWSIARMLRSIRVIFMLYFNDYEIINAMQTSVNVSSGWAKFHSLVMWFLLQEYPLTPARCRMYSIGSLPSLCIKFIVFLDWLATIKGPSQISPRLSSPSPIYWRKVKSLLGMRTVMKHSRSWRSCWPPLLCWHSRTSQSPSMCTMMLLVLG